MLLGTCDALYHYNLFVCDDPVLITNDVAKNTQLTTKQNITQGMLSPMSWSPDDIHQLGPRPWPDHVVTGHWRVDPDIINNNFDQTL